MYGNMSKGPFGFFGAWFVVCAIANVAIIGFVIWVIVKLLQHFGIV